MGRPDVRSEVTGRGSWVSSSPSPACGQPVGGRGALPIRRAGGERHREPRAPGWAALRAAIDPPCASAIRRAIARPRPVPPEPWRVVPGSRVNGSKIRSRSDSGMPGPWSSTSIRTSSPCRRTRDADLAAGGRVVDGVVDQHEQELDEPVPVGRRAGAGPGASTTSPTPRSAASAVAPRTVSRATAATSSGSGAMVSEVVVPRRQLQQVARPGRPAGPPPRSCRRAGRARRPRRAPRARAPRRWRGSGRPACGARARRPPRTGAGPRSPRGSGPARGRVTT